MPESNPYIARLKQVERRDGREKMLGRAREFAGSLVLGRDFGETWEAFVERNPEIREFWEWLKRQADGPETEEKYDETY